MANNVFAKDVVACRSVCYHFFSVFQGTGVRRCDFLFGDDDHEIISEWLNAGWESNWPLGDGGTLAKFLFMYSDHGSVVATCSLLGCALFFGTCFIA